MLKKFGKWYLYALGAFAVFAMIAGLSGTTEPDAQFKRAQQSNDTALMKKISDRNPDLIIGGEKASDIVIRLEEKEKAEAERVAKEKAEAERVAKEKAEAERVAKEKAEQEAKKVPKDKYSLKGVTYKDTVMCVSKDKLVEFGIAIQYVQKKAQKMVNKGECTIVPTNVPIYFKPESYSSKGFFMKMSDEVKMKYADGTNVFLFVNTSDIKYP